jgi:hypothetical protein
MTIKRYSPFVFSLCLLCIAANSAELDSFEKVRSKYREHHDPTRISHLYNRCAALQLNVAALLTRKGQKQGARDYEQLAQHYMIMSETVEREIDKKRGASSKDVGKIVERAVANISEFYGLRMKENHAKRGDYIVGDAVLEGELKECMLPDQFEKKAIDK